MRVRGLKSGIMVKVEAIGQSHPSRVRGLEFDFAKDINVPSKIAPSWVYKLKY